MEPHREKKPSGNFGTDLPVSEVYGTTEEITDR